MQAPQFVCYSSALYHADDYHLELLECIDRIENALRALYRNRPDMRLALEAIMAESDGLLNLIRECIKVDDSWSGAGAMASLRSFDIMRQLRDLLEIQDLTSEQIAMLQATHRDLLELELATEDCYYKLGHEVAKVMEDLDRDANEMTYRSLRGLTVGHIVAMMNDASISHHIGQIVKHHDPFTLAQQIYISLYAVETYADEADEMIVSESSVIIHLLRLEDQKDPIGSKPYRDWCLEQARDEMEIGRQSPYLRSVERESLMTIPQIEEFRYSLAWDSYGSIQGASNQMLIENFQSHRAPAYIEYALDLTSELTKLIYVKGRRHMCSSDKENLFGRFPVTVELLELAFEIEMREEGDLAALSSMQDNQFLTPYLAFLVQMYVTEESEHFTRLISRFEQRCMVVAASKGLPMTAVKMLIEYL